MRRLAIAVVAGALFASIIYIYAQRDDSLSVSGSPLSGGATTVNDTSRDAFARPLANLPTARLREFAFGNKLFNTNWVQAPASLTSLDGLGPTFNRVSCSGCHFKDGRGRPPLSNDEGMDSMLLRLSIPGTNAHGGPNPHPKYGDQLNDKAIPGVKAEGKALIFYETIDGVYADDTPYSLQKPKYQFTDLGFGELGDDILFSPRVAPPVFGLGLLEAVAQETILARADPTDADKDGISGRPNYVWDIERKTKALGRFGWKANVATLKQQDAGAAVGDMGITNPLQLKENCPTAQTDCNNSISGGAPEMSEMQFERLTFYTQTLAPPARRDVNDEQVKRGAKLFEQAQCSACHLPKMRTGRHPVAELSDQDIQPFTDLLLHDMGEGLADNRPDFDASGTEWRTPPLWGIGLVKTVNHHTFFLHDGRARNLEEAILWHGGEAKASMERFKKMSKQEREALIRFLESL